MKINTLSPGKGYLLSIIGLVSLAFPLGLAGVFTGFWLPALLIGIAFFAVLIILRIDLAFSFFPLVTLFSFYDPLNLGVSPEKILLLVISGALLISKMQIKNKDNEKPFNKLLITAYILFILTILGSAMANSQFSSGALVVLRTAIMRALTIYLVYQIVVSERTLRSCIFAIAVLAVAIYGWMIFTLINTGDILFFRLIALRIDSADSFFSNSIFENPNIVSLYGVIIFPIMFTASITARAKLAKAFYFVLSILSIFAVAITFSRSGVLDLAIMLPFLVWQLKFKKSVVFTVILAIIAILLVFSTTPYMSQLAEKTLFGNDPSANIRIGISRVVLASFQDNPLFGSGPDTFRAQVIKYPFLIEGLPHPEVGVAAHNDLFSVIVETGILGLAAFLLLFGLFLRELKNIYQNIRNQDLKIIYIGLLASLLGVLVDSFFHQILIHSIVWYLLSLPLAIAKFGISKEAQ